MKHLYSLLPYLKKFKKKIYSGFFFIILSNASDSLYPLVIGMAIDDLSKGTLRHNLLTYVLVGLLIVVLRGTLSADICSRRTFDCSAKRYFPFSYTADSDSSITGDRERPSL